MTKKSFSRIVRIVTGDRVETEDPQLLEGGLPQLERFVHFWVLVWRSFVRNRCPVRASALSYTTLLAMIPMLAVAMSVTSMFLKTEGQEKIESFIQQFVDRMVPVSLIETNNADSLLPFDDGDEFAVQPPATNELAAAQVAGTNQLVTATQTNAPVSIADARVVAAQKRAARYIHRFIQNTYSGTLGVTGMIFLLITAIMTLTRIEEAFNDIWGVTRGRNWLARVVQYWATISLGPLLLVAAVGLAGGSYFQKTRSLLTSMPYAEALISQLLPIVVICLSFSLFYKLVPNTKVNFSAALVGGTLAGTAWHFYNLLGFLLASRAVSASKIYGSLALIPLFMGGLYMVWLTVLFGAQVAYAFQNRAVYLQEKLAENVNQRGREFIALRLMTCIGQRYQLGLRPPTVQEISTELGVPSRLVSQVMQTLLAARLVVEVTGIETAYAPARPLDSINCHHILIAMRATVGQELLTRDEPVRAEVFGEFARIQAAEKEAAASVSMLALVNRAQARLQLPASPAASNEVQSAPVPLPPVESQPVMPAAVAPVVEIESTPPRSSKQSAVVASTAPATKPIEEKEEEESFPL